MINPHSQQTASGQSSKYNAPVWEPCFDNNFSYENGDELPGIWITEPVEDDGNNILGRTYVMLYPQPIDPDSDGWDALHWGGGYYSEGMARTDPGDREKRIECFQAAELLYRHSAGKGNSVAHLCLGYVYSYDRCEGGYWRNSTSLDVGESYKRPYPREERAFECFKVAAEAGICEGCYKLGDMYKHGIGCEANAVEAFSWYKRASELGKSEHPVIIGSFALRLAECYEEGFGCGQDFGSALEWYKRAESGLDVAVEAGEHWYAKALAGARAGVKRCKQELI